MGDVDDVAVLLGRRFLERRDVKAWQYADGHYEPERSPIKMGDVRAHLAGDRSMGHYLLSAENKCRLFAFDLDLAKQAIDGDGAEFSPREVWLQPDSPARAALTCELVCMAEGLARRTHRLFDVPVAIAVSGSKGVHVYAFTGSVPASEARAAAHEVLDSFGCFRPTRGQNFWKHDSDYASLDIEVFPKQDTLDGKDLGNLMRLPLGVNAKSKLPSYFIEVGRTPRDAFHKLDATVALSGEALPWQN